jgi:hypothetical protein
VWPVGAPPATAAAATERPRITREHKGGHYGHSQIPDQDHWDPGAIDTEIVPGRPRRRENRSGRRILYLRREGG